MSFSHVRVRNLVVGDVLADGETVTMLGLSSARPGKRLVCAKSPAGRFLSNTFENDALVQVRY